MSVYIMSTHTPRERCTRVHTRLHSCTLITLMCASDMKNGQLNQFRFIISGCLLLIWNNGQNRPSLPPSITNENRADPGPTFTLWTRADHYQLMGVDVGTRLTITIRNLHPLHPRPPLKPEAKMTAISGSAPDSPAAGNLKKKKSVPRSLSVVRSVSADD